MKFCYKCKTEKNLTEFGRNKSRSDGVQGYCKKCRAIYEFDNKPLPKEKIVIKATPGFKFCSNCKIEKQFDFFSKEKSTKDGYQRWCKECSKKERDAWFSEHPSYKQQWRENNPEYNKKWHEAHPEYAAKQIALWNKNNPGRALLRAREWYAKFPERAKKKNQEIKKRRLATDPLFKLLETIRRRLNSAIKRNTKGKRTRELLGCTVEQLKIHLESTFYIRKNGERMDWKNNTLRGWHIDHIRPCSSFDFSDPEQQKQCFHWTNLQALWAEDNMSKGDKLNYVRKY